MPNWARAMHGSKLDAPYNVSKRDQDYNDGQQLSQKLPLQGKPCHAPSEQYSEILDS